ncbi:glycosyltransferase [Deinococcus frigens]|uniref:glycosyltransferase n=1 Tax=Deinococcus frigens TaxID=249403 RepID=UPI00068EA64C|nr:glycosyltransferase [Deinococcus frigens]
MTSLADQAPTVCAVILTYNRQALLRGCLACLLGQTRPPDQILVVDNASSDGTAEMLAREYPDVRVLVLSPNLGAAGGFAAGMAQAYSAGFDWLWLMDDDACPRPDALERLLAAGADPDTDTAADVLVPWQCSAQGKMYGVAQWQPGGLMEPDPATLEAGHEVQLFAFIGPLISRAVIERVGLPYAEYFIDMFDWEYSLRVQQAGLRARLVPDSVIDHEAGEIKLQRLLGVGRARARYWRPGWRVYYDTRNALLTFRRRRLGWPTTLHYLASQPRSALRELALEPDGLRRARLRWWAVRDGLRGVAGERPEVRQIGGSKR